jgi:hypothetical protein
MANNDKDKKKKDTIWTNLRRGLSVGAMAMGEGMTGRPYLSNYQKMQMEREQAKEEFQKWQAEQQLKEQQAAFDRAYKMKMINQGVPVYTFGAEGTPQMVGNVPRGAKVVPPASMQTGEQKMQTQVGTQAAKGQQEANVNFRIAQNKLRTTMAAFKAMVAKEGAGRAGGAARLVTGATGVNPYVKAFEGQLVESAAALAKLAAPSARVGQEIINQFKKTLPTKWSTMPEAITQIRFSMHNAYATALGKSGQSYTPELQSMVDEWVNEIANVEPMKLESLKAAPKAKDPLGLR